MRKIPWYLVVIGMMLVLYSLALYKKPEKLDWTPTLINKDKIPYGGYIVHASLDSLFGYKPYSLRITPYEFCDDTATAGTYEVYMFIAFRTPFSQADTKALLDYVHKGNDVFISSEFIGPILSDSLNIKVSDDMAIDSVSTRLVNPSLGNGHFSMKKGTINTYLKAFDTAKAVVLGMNSRGRVNYIMQVWGQGRVFINTVPAMYTNYSLLAQGNEDYVSASLSYLNGSPDSFYWDEYFKQGREGERSPLRVILQKPMLKAALYTALAAIVLFMIFQAKRRQRIIPVVTPPANSTVDFVETVSQVYLNKGNHRNIALKQVTYLFEHIRSQYGIDTSMPDDAFARKLAHKTGYPENEAKQMVDLLRFVRSEETISDQHLVRLNQYIQEFHKYANK